MLENDWSHFISPILTENMEHELEITKFKCNPVIMEVGVLSQVRQK